MDKNELKKILKPLIKECIKEVVFEEGVLSNIVSEVAKGMSGSVITEQKAVKTESGQEIRNMRKQLLESVSDGYDDVKPKPSKPASRSESQYGPMKNIDPNDRGVDITAAFGDSVSKWRHLAS